MRYNNGEYAALEEWRGIPTEVGEVALAKPQRVFSELDEVERRLAELGLTEEPFKRASQEFYFARANTTAHHPRIHAGFNGWSESIRSLRDDLVPSSWWPDEVCGVNYVVSPDGRMAITPATGDEFAGRREGNIEPRTKNDKGPRLQDAVKVNAALFTRSFIPAQEADAVQRLQRRESRSKRKTWILLVYLDVGKGEIRAELSLPEGMDEDNHVSRWKERILLSPTSFDGIHRGRSDDYRPADKSPDITVKIVKKKTG